MRVSAGSRGSAAAGSSVGRWAGRAWAPPGEAGPPSISSACSEPGAGGIGVC